MSQNGGMTARSRSGALALSVGLGLAGLALVLLSDPAPLPTSFSLAWYALVPAFVLARRFPIDFEFRKQSHSVTLTQLPLAVGAVFADPSAHLAAAALGTVLDSVLLRRQQPLKTAFNVGVAAAEVGAVTFIVQLVAADDHPGPGLWLALFVGLLVGEAVGNLAVTGVMRILGVTVSRSQLLQPLTFAAVSTTVFTCLAVVAVLSVWTDARSLVVIAVVALGLGLAYRGHRRIAAQQQTTERLYEFVKDLGPLDLDDPASSETLQHVRTLLYARHLDLAVCESGDRTWRHVVVSEPDGDGAQPVADALVESVASSMHAQLRSGDSGDADRMATPLVGSAGLLGILTATERLGEVRPFDMGDLRLLETVAAELATALERGRLLADLARAATTDSLTALPNLAEVTRRIDGQIAEHGEVLLAAVAVDSFREVNDTLGHQVGDELLIETTRRLRLVSGGAVVGRIGGGRFVVAVPAIAAGRDAAMFGLGLRAQVEGTAQVGPVGTHIRLSVGVVSAPEHGSDAATLLRRAETAMYGARHVNGGPVLWEPAYEVKGQRRLAVVMALREALAVGAIGVAFQPKVETKSGRVTGVEALARWTHPALGPIGPDEFIPLAEASNLMAPLTASVLRQALVACKGWQRRANSAGVAVNVSADTVLDPSFVTEVAAIMTAVGVSPDLLTLELTEGVVVSDPALAAERLGELRSLGVHISVDDFGTGYSSLTYLKGLPVDEVKIDKGFVDGVEHEPADRAVVRAVVDIAHTLGLKVVAEGVENDEQEAVLRQLGVDEVQGYLHARPMPALDMAAWLRRRESAMRN